MERLPEYTSSRLLTVPKVVLDELPTTKLDKFYYYVSDLHLDYEYAEVNDFERKSLKEIKNLLTKKKIEDYCAQAAANICNAQSDNVYINQEILFICGDIASDPRFVSAFFNALSKFKNFDSHAYREKYHVYFPPRKIIYILGNHEYWEAPEIIKGIEEDDSSPIILDNEVYVAILDKNTPSKWPILKYQKYPSAEIVEMSDEKLTELIKTWATIPILGGTGFSGCNPEFNAEQGQIYRGYITTVEEDQSKSKIFCNLYNKLVRCKGNKKLIVATHNPPSDWMSCEPGDGCWYVYGHTHKEELIPEQHMFGDNQWGYINPNLKYTAKFFIMSGYEDIFADKEDGIYEITSEDFRRFNLCQGISGQCNRDGQIYCIKSNGYYLFILELEEKYYLLNGGQINKLKVQDLQYYLEYAGLMGQHIGGSLEKYMAYMSEISKQVKTWGGNGRIHGCIIDIDYYNHIYLNPWDFTITCYFALDMIKKIVYPNIISLLTANCPKLVPGYQKSVNNSLTLFKDTKISKGVSYTSTDIYKASRKAKILQATFTNKVVRAWNDEIIKPYLPEDNIWFPKKAIKPIPIKLTPNEKKERHDQIVKEKNELKLRAGKSLSDVAPELAKQWHPTKNGNLTPDKITYGSSKKVWWVCPVCGNEWQAVIANRYNGTGCRACHINKLKKNV